MKLVPSQVTSHERDSCQRDRRALSQSKVQLASTEKVAMREGSVETPTAHPTWNFQVGCYLNNNVLLDFHTPTRVQ